MGACHILALHFESRSFWYFLIYSHSDSYALSPVISASLPTGADCSVRKLSERTRLLGTSNDWVVRKVRFVFLADFPLILDHGNPFSSFA